MKDIVSSYLSFEVVTRVTLTSQDDIVFPAVTICNFNVIRKDYVKRVNLTEALLALKSNDVELIKAPHLETIFNTSAEDMLREGAHKMDKGNMLINCVFQGRYCGEEHFKPVFTTMGLCYTFNKENSSFSSPGEDFGLKLHLSAEQDKYYSDEPRSSIAGFKLHVHSQNEPPLLKENGFAVMPGTCTFVAVKRTKVISLPAPYRTNCENKKLPGTTVYSKAHCYEACRQSFIVNKCRCRNAEMSKMPNIPNCTFKQEVLCVYPQLDAFANRSLNNCSCPKPCDVTVYETRLSYAQYPSEDAKEARKESFAKRLHGTDNVSSDMIESTREYMGQNIVQIRIFLQDLNTHIIEDVPKYQLSNMFAEIGGMLGLLLGASVISVVEFFEFLFSLFVIKCRKQYR